MTDLKILELQRARDWLSHWQAEVDRYTKMCDHYYGSGRSAVTKQGDCAICKKGDLPYDGSR